MKSTKKSLRVRVWAVAWPTSVSTVQPRAVRRQAVVVSGRGTLAIALPSTPVVIEGSQRPSPLTSRPAGGAAFSPSLRSALRLALLSAPGFVSLAKAVSYPTRSASETASAPSLRTPLTGALPGPLPRPLPVPVARPGPPPPPPPPCSSPAGWVGAGLLALISLRKSSSLARSASLRVRRPASSVTALDTGRVVP